MPLILRKFNFCYLVEILIRNDSESLLQIYLFHSKSANSIYALRGNGKTSSRLFFNFFKVLVTPKFAKLLRTIKTGKHIREDNIFDSQMRQSIRKKNIAVNLLKIK